MTDFELTIDDKRVEPSDAWALAWADREAGLVSVGDRDQTEIALVEGSGTDWLVTLRGRRIRVAVRTWRERILADAESASRGHAGPIEVRATLPGLVVAVAVREGDEVSQGTTLLTLEAMKMQNEVRSPRSGRVAGIAVEPGQAVAAGAPLLRIE